MESNDGPAQKHLSRGSGMAETDPGRRLKGRSSVAANSVGGARLNLCGFLLLCLACLLPGLTASAQQYTFSRFGQTDGLLNQDVSSIVQDARGVLWVGTENGLFRADGSHFVQVDSFRRAEYGSVLAMHADAAGRLWVLGGKRLVFFTNGEALHAVHGVELNVLVDDGAELTSFPDDPDTLFMLRNGVLQAIHSADGGTNWNATPLFSGALLDAHPRLRKLAGLAVDPARGVLWLGCGDGLCEIRPASRQAVDRAPVVTEWNTHRGIPPNAWTYVMLSRDGAVWLRGTGNVLRLNPETWKVETFGDPSAGKAPQLRYSRLIQSVDGEMLANLPDGLARLHEGDWTSLGATNGLPPSEIETMFFDRSGGFWLAPMGQGIWRWLGYGNWQSWTHAEGMSSNVDWKMLRDRQGAMWVATSDGLNRIDAAQNRVVPLLTSNSVLDTEALASDTRGFLWTGTSDGRVIEVDPVTQHLRQVATGMGFVYRLFAERPAASSTAEPHVWICSATGLWFVSAADNWKNVHRIIDPSAPSSTVFGATQDRDGRLWFSAEGGVYGLNAGVWHRIKMPPGAKLVDYPLISVAPDGTFWMQAAMPVPLLHLRISGDQASLIDSVPGTVIGSDDMSFMLIDRRNWLWVGTDLGVYVFDGKRWVQCTQEDGLISDDTDTNSVYEDADGSMWFGTASGVSHLLHPSQLFRVGAPNISVRDVRLDNRVLEAGVRQRFNIRKPELRATLFSTYYTRPRAVAFRYRLLGLENEWQTTDNGEFVISGLSPGEYTLSLQAMDRRVHEFSEPIDYPFTILPPWYLRSSAEIAAAVLLFLIGALAWRISLARLKTSEASLKARVDRQTAQLLAEKMELERTQRELVETARRDALTGLLNRSAIFDVLAVMRRQALSNGTQLSVVMADLDHFKSINDRCGHAVGDAVLRECAERLRETLRPADAVGRYGGEELMLLIPGLTPSHAATRMEEIRASIASQPIVHGEHVLHVTCSFGVAWLNEHHENLEAVVNAADAALYIAKQNGRNRVEFTPDAVKEAFVTNAC